MSWVTQLCDDLCRYVGFDAGFGLSAKLGVLCRKNDMLDVAPDDDIQKRGKKQKAILSSSLSWHSCFRLTTFKMKTNGSYILMYLAFLGNAMCSRLDANTSGSFSWRNGVQAVLGLAASNESQGVNSDALLRSIAAELPGRLSVGARVIIEGADDFDLVNARYTEYRRPTYIAGVQVREEIDVVETVGDRFGCCCIKVLIED